MATTVAHKQLAARGSETLAATLLSLQHKCRVDPEGYSVEIRQQFAHFQSASMVVLNDAGPGDSRSTAIALGSPLYIPPELALLVLFFAHVLPSVSALLKKTSPASASASNSATSRKWQHDLQEVVNECPCMMIQLLRERLGNSSGTVAGVVELRRALAKAISMLHARGMLDGGDVLPLCFSLFKCRDFALRSMMFAHIVRMLSGKKKGGNGGGGVRGAIAGFLHRMVLDEDEVAAKKSLAVVIELYRNGTWRDARAVGVVAAAVEHPSGRVLRAACNFFLGQDVYDDDDDDDDEEEDEDGDDGLNGRLRVAMQAATSGSLTSEDVYRASKKGTNRTKKRKQEKLKKVQKAARKAARKDVTGNSQGFTAIQLLSDPQVRYGKCKTTVMTNFLCRCLFALAHLL